MSGRGWPRLLAVICVLATACTASPTAAQSPTAGQNPSVAAETTPVAGCKTLPKASAGGASVVQATDESLQHKSWQARGGEIQYTIKSFSSIPAEASVLVCFRWKSKGESNLEFIERLPSRLELSNDGKLLKVTTTVPRDLGPKPSDLDTVLPLVPLAEVRILAIDKETKKLAVDVTTAMGITYPIVALLFAIGTVAVGFWILYIAVARRLTHPGIRQANWLLRIISTPSGYASLSQFQILLWTFLVAASAVYVMSLSGELIQITTGMLVLLGIAGAAVVGAKAHSEAQAATADSTATKAAIVNAEAQINAAQTANAAAAAPENPVVAALGTQAVRAAETTSVIASATRDRANALKNPPATQIPRWSDLIVTESVKDDGTVTRELDVARFQMLLFTLVTGVFVLINVVTTYVIPEISQGFQTLLGISNAVYMGSKVVQRS